MRKIIAVILTLCVLLGGTALAELSDDFTGTWYLDTLTGADGLAISALASRMSMVLVLNADGTGMATSSVADNKPEEEAARWTLNGGAITIVFDSVTMNAAFDGEKLTLFSDDPGSGGYMVFTREEPKPIALPAAVEAAGEADFLGSWTASVIALDGVAVDIGLLGSTPVLTLDVTPGQVVMTSVWMGNEPRSIVCTSVFEDGALTLTDDTGLVTHLFLGEDGGLQATSEEGGPVQTIYYVAAEGAALAPAA